MTGELYRRVRDRARQSPRQSGQPLFVVAGRGLWTPAIKENASFALSRTRDFGH